MRIYSFLCLVMPGAGSDALIASSFLFLVVISIRMGLLMACAPDVGPVVRLVVVSHRGVGQLA